MIFQFIFIIIYFDIIPILSIKIFPDEYKALDNPYDNDIESSTEDYHYIISSFAAREYIDYYKGIYYKPELCCYWNYYYENSYLYCFKRSSTILDNYTSLNNINDTNLKEMHHYACVPEKGKQVNILFNYRKSLDDIILSIQMRFTNIYEEPFDLRLATCKTYNGTAEGRRCIKENILDNITIPNNSFYIYTFKFDPNYYYIQSENYSIPHENNGMFNFATDNLLYLFFDEDKQLYFNSYIISLNLKRYVLSLSGHSLNSCANSGCISGYSCKSRNPSVNEYYMCYNNQYTTECSLFGCIPGAYCNSKSLCLECDHQCRTCKDQNYTNCTSCYSTSIYPQWKYHHKSTLEGPCIFEFFPINKIKADEINVPIPLSYRITFEFWINIHNPVKLINKNAKPSLSSFILKDFFSFSLHQNSYKNDSIYFVLTPFEFFFPFLEDYISINDYYEKYLNTYDQLQYLRVEVNKVTSKWIYVKAGISYSHKKFFINNEESDLNYIPVYYQDHLTNYNFLMRKFYRKGDSTSLKIQGFEYLGTDIYIRNFNLYSEYMFNKINSPNYFDFHSITNILVYPQLLFSIPFSNISVNSIKSEIKHKLYDFSGQYNQDNNNVVITEITSNLIKDHLAPKRNFYRLNFLKFDNKEYMSTDLLFQGYIDIECLKAEESKSYCYDDGQPYICENNYNLMALYEKKIIPENYTNMSDIIDDSDIADFSEKTDISDVSKKSDISDIINKSDFNDNKDLSDVTDDAIFPDVSDMNTDSDILVTDNKDDSDIIFSDITENSVTNDTNTNININITENENEENTSKVITETTNLITTYPTFISDTIEIIEYRKNYSFCVSDCVQNDTDGIEHKYMRLPNIKRNKITKEKIKNDLCSYECDPETVENCPSSNYMDIHTFKCKENENLFSYFYQCFNNEKSPSEDSALQFSGTFNTKSIYFPLNQNLSNFYIEMWFHPDLLTQEERPKKIKYFFATNNHQMYYDTSSNQLLLNAYKDEESDNDIFSTFNLMQNIYYYGWNHFIFYVHEEIIENKLYTKFGLSLTNVMIDIGMIEGKSTANKICFCNRDDFCCDRLSMITWMDLYIKEIKIWDSNFVNFHTINDYNKYKYIIPGGLFHMYNLTAAVINYNKIIDSINPNNSDYNAQFPFDFEETNPDGDINYNIGWNFNWNDFNYPKFIISTKRHKDINRVEIFQTGECYEGCLKCFGFNEYQCYSCKPGYVLNGAYCIKYSENSSIYYYMNPLKPKKKEDIVPDLELDFQSLNLDNYTTLTLFFYIKIYGFTDELYELYKNDTDDLLKLITLSEDSNFILFYDIKSDIILLKLGDKIQYSYKGIFTKFGNWIPISISAYRSKDLNFRHNFASMSFDNILLPYLGFDEEGLFSYFPIETFKISKYLIAHIADVTLYDLFIINAYGYAQHKYTIDGKFSNSSSISRSNIIIKTFKMFCIYNDNDTLTSENIEKNIINDNQDIIDSSIDSSDIFEEEDEYSDGIIFNKCISPEDVLNYENVMKKITCKEDYLPYLDQKCLDEEFVSFKTSSLPPTCIKYASKCENIEQVTKYMTKDCDYLYASCDTKSLNSIYNLIYTYTPIDFPNNNYIICGNALGLDLARFSPGLIGNITSPTKEFKIEFWYLTQSYINNNFKSLSIEWTDHIKIEVFYNNETLKYGARCIAMNDIQNLMEFEYIENSNAHNRWRYIVCGVDNINKIAYLTNLMSENRVEVTFRSDYSLSEDYTTLYISENSPTNYGLTYIKELRLWNCYDCSSNKAFTTFVKEDIHFSNVIHYFNFESPSGLLQDYRQFPNITTSYQFITKIDFNGYGLFEPIPDLPDCNENGQLYYSIKKEEGCDTMINLNILNNDIIFKDIPASRSNSYTMEFWFFIESADNFTEGMNLIYEDHMTISTFAHDVNDNDLDVFCFPQGYRNKLDNVFGNNIEKRYQLAQNKAKYTFINGYSKWNYVRCAYSFDLLKYYINDEEPRDIENEIFFDSNKNDKPFKMFMNNLVNFKINLSKENFVRIIMQTINIYRDYIPQSIQTKYKDMQDYITNVHNNPYYPILFSVNFPKNFNPINDKLIYYVSDYDINPKENALYHFLSDIEVKSYKTYPLYDSFILCNYHQVYNEEKKICEAITEPNNCDKTNIFCLNDSKLFWCPYGKYLDINNFTCNEDCPEGFTRPPDNKDGYGICYINITEKHYSEYPRLNEELKQGIYETKFKCEENYTLVYYNCIPNEKVNTSGIYFSSKYKFSNLIAYYNKLNIVISNYFIDFWLLFDLSSNKNISEDNQRYTIFIAYPHFITRYKGKIQYNNGYSPSNYYDIIDVEDIKYNWNHVVIENYQVNGKTSSESYKVLNIYWNNNFTMPKLSLKFFDINDYALAQIAFCHEANKEYTSCILGLTPQLSNRFYPFWDDAYYKDIKVWNKNATSISSINTFGTDLNKEITMNIISYYSLTLDTISPGKIKSLVNNMDKEIDFITEYNLDKKYDNSQQINWVTDFDLTLPDNYVYSINYTNTNEYLSNNNINIELKKCEGNCYQCFSGNEDDCISCKSSYIISGTKCLNITGLYFKVPINDKNLEQISFNEDLSNYDEITILFYMKFLGSVRKSMGKIPILYFFGNKSYFGWDLESQNYIINIMDDSARNIKIFSYKESGAYVGQWALFSISIFNSKYQSKFPNMIQFMINDNIIRPEIDLIELHKIKINFDLISINNNLNALFYDLRIYNKYFIGANGINPDISTYITEQTLIKRILFKSNNAQDNDCLSLNDIKETLENDIQCIGDFNPYDKENLICDLGQYMTLNSQNNEIECNNCSIYCSLKYCISDAIKNCSCINDDPYHWLRYDFNEENQIFYCEKLEIININKYNDIIINNIDIPLTTGYMIEFWFYLETYIANSNFEGVQIIWEHFIKVEINHYQNELIKISCYPSSDNNEQYIIDNQDKFNTWVFYRCSVNKELKQAYTQKNKIKFDISDLFSDINNKTRLIIKDNSNSPYGVFLLRELRLYNAINNPLYDISHLNLDTSKYISLIHYYKGILPPNISSSNEFLYDSVKNIYINLTYKYDKYPYSYISQNYTELILCEEGYEYRKNANGDYECTFIDKNDLIERLAKDETIYTVVDLVSKVDDIYKKTLSDFNISESNNTSSELTFDESGNIILNEPNISNSYCSNNGMVQIVQKTKTCYCLRNTVGKYCHLKLSEYSLLENMYEIFLEKTEQTYSKHIKFNINNNTDEEAAFLSSFNNLILGNQLYTKDGTFATEAINWLDRNVIYNIKQCNIEYIKTVDNLFSTLILVTNKYKAELISNRKGTNRDAELSLGQEEEINSNILLIKKQLEYLTSLCFSETINNIWSYRSENIIVDLLKFEKNDNIDIDEFIKLFKLKSHEPYFQFGDCLNIIKKNDDNKNINIQFITWVYSPWYHHRYLNYNHTSNYIEIKIYSDDLKELKINKCNEGTNIDFYLNLINPVLVDIINNNSNFFKEGNFYETNNPIFTEPKYILEDGSISNMSLEYRRKKYYFEYFLVFKTLDEINRILINTDVEYKNLENNSYFKCISNHLSEFLLTYEYNKPPYKLAHKFYFLNHYKLYLNSKNIKGNIGFYSTIILLSLYITNFALVKLYLFVKKKKLGNKNFLLIEDFLMTYVYPYGNNEGDFFINKENMNKIFNIHLKFKNEKNYETNSNVLKLKENTNTQLGIKTEKNKLNKEKEKERKDAYLNENNNMNYGDIKNKVLYEQYYKEINAEGYSDNINEITNPEKESSNNKKREINNKIFSLDDNDKKLSIKKTLGKISKRVKNNYIIDEDIDSNEEMNQEIKEVKDFNSKHKINNSKLIHSLQISNENIRIRILTQLNINCFTFFIYNLKNRIIFINTFNGNYTYSASIKALCLPLYLELLYFFNTLIFIHLDIDDNETNYSYYINHHLSIFLPYCFLSIFIVKIYFYATRYFYNLTYGEIRKLLYEFKTNKNEFDKHYFNVMKKVKYMMIFETALIFLILILTYIFSFGFFAVYPVQSKIMLVSFICGIILDYFIYILFELLIAILFIFKKNESIVLIIDYLNRLLSYKMLSP